MSNEIIIYNNSSTYNRIFTIAKEYQNIFRNLEDIVNLSKKQ